jgi:hypothetical protein
MPVKSLSTLLHIVSFPVLLLLQYSVIATIFCYCYNIFLLLQYSVIATIFCYCYNILLLLQYSVIATIFCYYYNILLLLQYSVIATIFCYCYDILLLLQYSVITSINIWRRTLYGVWRETEHKCAEAECLMWRCCVTRILIDSFLHYFIRL